MSKERSVEFNDLLAELGNILQEYKDERIDEPDLIQQIIKLYNDATGESFTLD
jgi:hypothetical protein